MRAFYDNLNQVDSIFSSKVILFYQITEELPRHLTALNFCVSDTDDHRTFNLNEYLNEDFLKFT